MGNKIDQLKDFIASETRCIINLSIQLQKMQDQLDYNKDKLKYHQEQLGLLQVK